MDASLYEHMLCRISYIVRRSINNKTGAPPPVLLLNIGNTINNI